ncbi:MAG: CAP domain-containing protein [Saprospiraceae bacterium]|nr:CAP domain-containing protein [Saprospiraceae bacterium]
MSHLKYPIAMVCCILYYSGFTQTGKDINRVEGIILSFPAPQLIEFQVQEKSGRKSKILLRLPDSQAHLRRQLKRFQHQHWQVFYRQLAGQTEIVSIYGLGAPGENVTNPTPPPLFVIPESRTETHAPSKKRAVSANQAEIVRLTNIERWDNGMMPPLKSNDLLHNAGQGHSSEMAFDDFFAHCDLDSGTSPGQRVTGAGYSWNAVAENIAAGSSTASGSMGQWMGSTGHRNNILSTSYRALGVGYAYDPSSSPADRRDQDGNCVADGSSGPYYYYWTQNFGRRNNTYPVVIEREEIVTDSRTVDLYVYGTPVSMYESFTAVSMRFSNDNQNWSTWETYSPDKTWELSPGNGIKTVYAQIRNSSGSVKTASDQITLDGMECESIMTFSNETLTGTQTYRHCEIIADPNVLVTGNITFEANQVTLGTGVEIQSGFVFEITMMN